ncbi:MAG: hypothetical protein WCK58_04345 [Chloroflexota bacterium]
MLGVPDSGYDRLSAPPTTPGTLRGIARLMLAVALPVMTIALLPALHLPPVTGPQDVLSPAVVAGRNPYDDYLRFAALVGSLLLALWIAAPGWPRSRQPPRRRRGRSKTLSAATGRRLLAGLGIVASALWIAAAVTSMNPEALPSEFDNAELVSWLPAWLQTASPPSQFVLIHGPGVDIVPALAARALGAEGTAWTTRLVANGLVCLSAALFLGCLWWLTSSMRVGTAPGTRSGTGLSSRLLGFIGLTVGLLLLAPPSLPFLSIPLLLGQIVASVLLTGSRRRPRTRLAAALALGLLTPLGVGWSYQYGMVGASVLGAAMLMLVLERPLRTAVAYWVATFAGGALGALTLAAVLGPIGLVAVVDHLRYWATAGIWSWETDLFAPGEWLLVMRFVVLALICASALWHLARAFRAGGARTAVNENGPVVLLLVAFVVGSRDMLDRTDGSHMERSIALGGLLLASLTSNAKGVQAFLHRGSRARLPMLAAVEVLVISFGFLGFRQLPAATAFVAGLTTQNHSDTYLLGPIRAQAGQALREAADASGSGCAVIFSVSPLPLFASDLPPCAPFGFTFYARTAAADTQMAATILRLHPPVVFDERRASSIDGLTAASVTPRSVQEVLGAYRPTVPGDVWIWEWNGTAPIVNRLAEGIPATAHVADRPRIGPATPDRAGLERSVSGSLTDPAQGTTVDAVYLSVDGGPPVSAGPLRDGDPEAGTWTGSASQFSIPLPTRGLAPGRHEAHLWALVGGQLVPLAAGTPLLFTVDA